MYGLRVDGTDVKLKSSNRWNRCSAVPRPGRARAARGPRVCARDVAACAMSRSGSQSVEVGASGGTNESPEHPGGLEE